MVREKKKKESYLYEGTNIRRDEVRSKLSEDYVIDTNKRKSRKDNPRFTK